MLDADEGQCTFAFVRFQNAKYKLHLLTIREAYFKEQGEPLFSSHMIDLSEEDVDFNIETTAKYLKRAAPMKQFLEMV